MTQTTALSKWFVLLLAIATGVCVASNYYAQPLLYTISQDLHISEDKTGVIITIAQIAYAAGLLFLVPLGDLIERRKLIISMIFASIIGLIICATAQNLTWLLIGTAISGFFAVVAQIIVPFAAGLATPSERGKIVGTMMSGLLLGILLARTAAGICSHIGSWRTIYMVATGVLLIITFLLLKTLPPHPITNKMGYANLLASTLKQFIKHPKLILFSSLGALNFCVFSLLWTPIALVLSDKPFGYNDFTIGLLGLIGAAGALMAPIAGKLADKGKSHLVITLGFTLLILSWIPLALINHSFILLIGGILILDLAVQSAHVTSMNLVYKLDYDARNRLNACYMFCYFIGGATGSFISTWVFYYYQWVGVSVVGASVASIALLLWIILHPKQEALHE